MNLVGQKFGKLYVVEKTKEKSKNNGEYKYKCLCDCGKELIVRGSNLKYGNSKSCGCQRIINNSPISKGFRKKNKRLYNIYTNMKQRCYDKNCVAYKYYGNRGIIICNEWLNDFVNFYNWSLENGYKNNLTIDRIDVNGNYEPLNCRWVTMQKQSYNKRNSKYITHKGETKTLSEWAKILNMSSSKLSYRIKKWDIERAFEK